MNRKHLEALADLINSGAAISPEMKLDVLGPITRRILFAAAEIRKAFPGVKMNI